MLSFSIFKPRPAYTSLVEKPEDQSEQCLLSHPEAHQTNASVCEIGKRQNPHRGISVFSFVLNLVLSAVIVILYLTRRPVNSHTAALSGSFDTSPRDLLYSPVPKEITSKHQIKKFSYGFNPSKTPYQATPPTKSLDHLWKNLYYNVSYLRLPAQIAAKLPNKTLPYPQDGKTAESAVADPGYYAANLAVFHQLHCLNSIRIGLSREYYLSNKLVDSWKFDEKRGPYGTEHISHCVNVLREAIMCAADTSVVTFQWNEEIKSAQPRADVLHVCRDFEGIWDWAWENRNVVPFDPRLRPSGSQET